MRERSILILGGSSFSESVIRFVKAEHFHVELVRDCDNVLSRIQANVVDAVVIDLTPSRVKGLELLRRIRSQSDLPILVLVSSSEDVDHVVALELGADDCMAKPVKAQELTARLRAVLRRGRSRLDPQTWGSILQHYEVGDLTIDTGTRTVTVISRVVHLTTTEFELLVTLVRAVGQVVTRETLSRTVLGCEYHPLNRSVDMHVCQLRKKLGSKSGGSQRIKTVRGVGYMYAASREELSSLVPTGPVVTSR